ncbi:MAG: Asp-tRNA(Asn)/Glu-tRNA(Gln) amidotransferase subunit GatC [Candidatus Roizmanbacteria bacterium]
MTKINMKYLAQLSKITLTDAEESKLAGQAEETIEYIKNLNLLDTTKTLPTSSVTGTTNVYRDDVVDPKRNLKAKVYSVSRIM